MKKALIVLVVLCASCATPSVIVRQNVHIERLGIYLEAGEHAVPLVSNQFDRALDEFIIRYNATPHRAFELFRAHANDSSTLRIRMLTTRFVSPGNQTAGVLVSMVGLSLPIVMAAAEAPILIFFYYFPKVRSITELSLSEDINGSTQNRNEFLLASPGFLMSPERQMTKHTTYFSNLLSHLVRQVAAQSARRKSKVVAKQ